MHGLVENQSKEVEKAVYGMGEYQFKPAYKSLEVECSKWFMMSCEQRQRTYENYVQCKVRNLRQVFRLQVAATTVRVCQFRLKNQE